MIWYVYILYSEKDNKLYVWCTNNFEKRVERHNLGYVPVTKHRRPLVLIHSENFKNKADAFQRERFLKSLWGARTKKKILKEYLKKIESRPNNFKAKALFLIRIKLSNEGSPEHSIFN